MRKLLSRVARWVRTLLGRFYFWCADSPPRSWFAHGFVSLFAAFAFASGGYFFAASELAFASGGGVGFLFYAVKEGGDWKKYWTADQLDQIHRGVSRKADGYGDLVGPTFVLLSGLAMYWISRWPA